ncbi:MAG TPA: FIST N-terminal domain-containing protein [Anaeromyxobacter sp.]|nr:FIST N-terminal domain-containing protein [Anaeromyxobacter sp.]
MRWASSLSRGSSTAEAFADAAQALEARLGGSQPDLLLVFASSDHAGELERVATLARARFPASLVAGCTAAGVIGDAHEAEEGPALSLTAAVLPRVALSAFHLEMTSLPRAERGARAWHAVVGAAPEARPKLLLLADPFTMDARGLIAGLDLAYPGAPKFGGLASGGRRAGENRLLLGRDVHRSGALGIAFSGDLAVETVIAQGCRPIGAPSLVTRCVGELLQELDGRPPIEVLHELHASLGVRDRELMRHSLFLGIEMRSERVEYDPGELLVRNILGADEETGAIAVGAELRPMMVVQFVLRDARTAEDDLRRMLGKHRPSGSPPAGALLFSCVGRGAGLFGRPDHDTALFEDRLGPAPLGGFFCNGEIGPVGGTTFLHGYTSAFAIFREAAAAT